MTLEKGINIETLASKMDNFSGAEIKAVCTEAGYFAIRENRTFVTKKDFFSAIDKVKQEERLESKEYLETFG
jgi:26S proteasome regulatory subunit T6